MITPGPAQPASPRRASAAAIAVPLVLALSSTAFAIALHQRTGAPGDQPFTLLLLAAAFVVGATRVAPSVRVGLAALAGFPVEAVVALTQHGGHSLLPIEFASTPSTWRSVSWQPCWGALSARCLGSCAVVAEDQVDSQVGVYST